MLLPPLAILHAATPAWRASPRCDVCLTTTLQVALKDGLDDDVLRKSDSSQGAVSLVASGRYGQCPTSVAHAASTRRQARFASQNGDLSVTAARDLFAMMPTYASQATRIRIKGLHSDRRDSMRLSLALIQTMAAPRVWRARGRTTRRSRHFSGSVYLNVIRVCIWPIWAVSVRWIRGKNGRRLCRGTGSAALEIVFADHQNKSDVGAAVARHGSTKSQGRHVRSARHSAVALAVEAPTRRDKNRIAIAGCGGLQHRFTGKSCSKRSSWI